MSTSTEHMSVGTFATLKLVNGKPATEQQEMVPRTGLSWAEVDSRGRPTRTFLNAKRALTAVGIQCSFDEFRREKTVWGLCLPDLGGALTDDLMTTIRNVICESLSFDPGKDNLQEAVSASCLETRVDALVTHLSSVNWDGEFRLDTWLSRYADADHTPLNCAIGVLLPIAMVRRALIPGCKFDLVVVLEGSQGAGKSSLLRALAGNDAFFTDAPLLTRDTKGVMETLRGKWVVEIPELSGLRKAEAEDVKAIISRQDDRARPAYGRHVESQPRRCVFVGSTNSQEYLIDDTGNRRFAPVPIGDIDLDGFRRDRDQLMAEAVFRERFYGPLVLPPEVWEDAHTVTEDRRVSDPWFDALASIFATPPVAGPNAWDFTPTGKRRITTEAVHGLLGISPRDSTPLTARRVKAVMHRLGWNSDRFRQTVGGAKLRGFSEP